MEVGARDVQGLPLLAQPAPRQSYSPMAGKPAPSTHEPPRQWNQAPVTLIDQWKNKGGRDGGIRMIQRLKEESCRQENAELSTWRWCRQGRPRLSQTTDRWPRPRSLFLTVLNNLWALPMLLEYTHFSVYVFTIGHVTFWRQHSLCLLIAYMSSTKFERNSSLESLSDDLYWKNEHTSQNGLLQCVNGEK